MQYWEGLPLSKEMINQLPLFLRKNEEFIAMFNTEDKQLQSFNLSVEDVRKQLNVDTATWGLNIYEKELNIPTDLKKPLEERRSVVKSKWRGSGKLDASLIKLVADAYTNGEVEVTYDGRINIKFNGLFGIPPNLADLQQVLDDIKPAFREVVYLFVYLFVRDVESISIAELEATPLSKFAGGVY